MGRRTGLCRLGVQEMNDDQVLKSEFYERPSTRAFGRADPGLSTTILPVGRVNRFVELALFSAAELFLSWTYRRSVAQQRRICSSDWMTNRRLRDRVISQTKEELFR
jgi:hypothetical protein